MIDDSIPWKEELLKVADRLESKTKQQRWVDRTAYLIERDFMVSAYALRKLIEAHKVSDRLRDRPVPVEKFKPTGKSADWLNRHRIWELYDLEHPERETIAVMKLCHQIVHSFVFTPSVDETAELFDGVYITSDRDKQKRLLFVAAADFIALCRDIGAEDVYEKRMIRGPDGQFTFTVIGGPPE